VAGRQTRLWLATEDASAIQPIYLFYLATWWLVVVGRIGRGGGGRLVVVM
jgi:hypothetical protein